MRLIQDSLNELAGTSNLRNQDAINILAGTTNRSQQDAFNIWAGTTGLSRQGAANVKAGTSNLSLQEALDTYATSGGSFTDPTDIAGLVYWFDAEDSPTWTDNGTTPVTLWDGSETVYRWDDLSGNGRNLVQATGANRPIATNSGGTNVLAFDGIAHWMQTGAFTLAQPFTIMMGILPLTYTANDYIFDGLTAGTGSLSCTAVSNQLAMNAGSAQPTVTITFGATPRVFTTTFNGGSSRIQINNNAGNSGNSGSSGPGGLTLGTNGTSPLFFGEFFCFFMVAYDSALSDTDKTNLYNWAVDKFAVL